MAVYGNIIMEQNRSMDMSDFIDFFQETTSQLELMFERANVIQSLKEANVLLEDVPAAVKPVVTNSEPEKVKKTLLEKVKEIWVKFVQMVKNAFEKLANAIHNKYMEINFVDKIVSKNKNIVTFENLKKAKENGWVGMPTNVPMINKIADPTDSKLYKDMELYNIQSNNNSKSTTSADFDNLISTEDDIDPILSAESLEDAKEKYKKFEEKLKKFNEDKKRENKSGNYTRNSFASADPTSFWSSKNAKGVEHAYFTITNIKSEDGKYYMPSSDGFLRTKELAEKGQFIIKNIKNSSQIAIKNLKGEKDIEMNNLKSYQKSKVDSEANQIIILYYKAKYMYSKSYISRMTKIMNTVLSIIREQHIIAINAYIHYVKAIKKYCKQ